MTQIDWTQYREFWRQRQRASFTPEMEKLASQVRQEAMRLSRILAVEFDVQRVYLFGSWVWAPEIQAESDLDLAVEGLPKGKRARCP